MRSLSSVGALVAPLEQMTMQMDFFQQRLGEEVPKLAHEVTKFSEERWFVDVPGWTVNHHKTPWVAI
jgi:hypothetical protein